MATIQRLETRFEANFIQMQAQLQRMQQANARTLANIAAQHNNSATSINRNWQRANMGQTIQNSLGLNNIKAQLSGMAPALAAAFSVTGAVAAADSYTRFSNSLKVAGLEGERLAQVQDHLFETAQRNGTSLEVLGQLYGRVASSAKELGASQADMLAVTDAVSAAVRVSGGTAESASGAILQFAQALSAGTVAAEEYNSMKEGLLPLLQAMANASDEYAGSVGKLTAAVKKQEVSSGELLQMSIAARKELEDKAAKAPLTVAASMQTLTNALTKYIGESDKSLGITARLSQGIQLFAANIDTLAKVIGVVATIIVSRYVAALTTSAIATVRSGAGAVALAAGMQGVSKSAILASTAMRGLSASMNFLAANGLFIAVSAIALALGSMAMAGMDANAAITDLNSEVERANMLIEETQAMTASAGAETTALGGRAQAAGSQVAGYASEVANATNKLNEMAGAAKRAQLAAIDEQRTRVSLGLAEAQKNSRTVRRRDALAEIDFNGWNNAASPGESFNRVTRWAGNEVQNWWSGGEFDRKNEAAMADGSAALARLDAEAARVRNTPDSAFAPRTPTSSSGASNKPSRSGAGRQPRQVDYRDEEAIHEQDMALLAIQIARTATLEQRHVLENQIATKEYQEASRRVAEDERLTDVAKASVLLSMANVSAQETELRLTEQKAEITARDLRTADQIQGYRNELSSIEEERLSILAGIAATEEDRWALEDEAIQLRRQRERDSRAADLRRIDAELQIATASEEIARLTRERAQAVAKGDAYEGQYKAEDAATADGRKTGLQRYASEVMGTKFDWQDTALKGLEGLEGALGDVMSGTKTLKEAFADMGKAIIGDIMRVVIRALVMKTIMKSFGLGGTGGGGPSADLAGLYASGTNYSKGGLALVGEKGPEIVAMNAGSKVMPNNVLTAMASSTSGGRTSSSLVVSPTIVIKADNAVMRSDIDNMVARGMGMAVQQARQLAAEDTQRRARNRLG